MKQEPTVFQRNRRRWLIFGVLAVGLIVSVLVAVALFFLSGTPVRRF